MNLPQGRTSLTYLLRVLAIEHEPSANANRKLFVCYIGEGINCPSGMMRSHPRIVNLFSQICEALITAHAKNIIHLDIKPANVFLIDNDSVPERIKVIDFGMARVLSKETGTTVTRFLGTYQYCSPEHFGGKVTYRSDIYSLGATLYHMIAGVIRFGTSYINAKIHPELELPPVPSVVSMRPELSHEVDVVIRKALSKNARDRQQSVQELLEEFRSVIGQTT